MENTQETRKKTFNLDERTASKEIKKFVNNDGITIDIIEKNTKYNKVTYTYVASGKNLFDKKTKN